MKVWKIVLSFCKREMLFCMPSMKKPDSSMQMIVVVDRPLTKVSYGKISCRPLGREPITFRWTGPNGTTVQVDESGSEAVAVVSGRYRIVATDALENVANVTVDVEEVATETVLIEEYACTPSSTLHSRDGRVEAVGSGFEKVERFLWSNGTQTVKPSLQDVPSGTYTMMPLFGKGEMVPPCIHLCPPGKITVRSSGR